VLFVTVLFAKVGIFLDV